MGETDKYTGDYFTNLKTGSEVRECRAMPKAAQKEHWNEIQKS